MSTRCPTCRAITDPSIDHIDGDGIVQASDEAIGLHDLPIPLQVEIARRWHEAACENLGEAEARVRNTQRLLAHLVKSQARGEVVHA